MSKTRPVQFKSMLLKGQQYFINSRSKFAVSREWDFFFFSEVKCTLSFCIWNRSTSPIHVPPLAVSKSSLFMYPKYYYSSQRFIGWISKRITTDLVWCFFGRWQKIYFICHFWTQYTFHREINWWSILTIEKGMDTDRCD